MIDEENFCSLRRQIEAEGNAREIARLYPYTAERRDVLGKTSPEAREISRGRGFCTLEGQPKSFLFFTQFIFHFHFFTSKLFSSGFVYNVLVLIFYYSHCFDILLACNISTMSHFASLLEHCQCFPREDVFLIFVQGSVRGNTVPRAVFVRTLPRAQGLYWKISSL